MINGHVDERRRWRERRDNPRPANFLIENSSSSRHENSLCQSSASRPGPSGLVTKKSYHVVRKSSSPPRPEGKVYAKVRDPSRQPWRRRNLIARPPSQAIDIEARAQRVAQQINMWLQTTRDSRARVLRVSLKSPSARAIGHLLCAISAFTHDVNMVEFGLEFLVALRVTRDQIGHDSAILKPKFAGRNKKNAAFQSRKTDAIF